jgi:hypothetical protein
VINVLLGELVLMMTKGCYGRMTGAARGYTRPQFFVVMARPSSRDGATQKDQTLTEDTSFCCDGRLVSVSDFIVCLAERRARVAAAASLHFTPVCMTVGT